MIRKPKRRGERGQTIILVAISIVSLLAMAALAIDVVTLYVASSEIKRAADAAALAGAKGIADSGVTTLQPGDPNLGAAEGLATTMANAAITAILPVNTVAGMQLTNANATVSIDFTTHGNGNPLITVALQRTGLPTFFAKIWGRTASTVSASSTAEVYNPSNSSPYTPIAPSSVKPWLVANADPVTGVPFILPGNLVETGGAVGKQFNLTADCATCFYKNPPPLIAPNASEVEYMPAAVTPNAGNNVCSSSCAGSDFEMSIACADVTTVYSCGGSVGVGFGNPGGLTGDSATGAECLIHAASYGSGQGQDSLNNALAFPAGPPQITGGTYAGNPYPGLLVSTSSSIVTIPIIGNSPGPLTIVGFMQAFINDVESGTNPNTQPGDINITVLNIAGCNAAPNSSNPVVGGTGTSPVPVRLIAPPSP